MSSNSFKIKDIFKDHWDTFVAQGYPIRPAVHKNVEKIINCGESSMGHALYFCEHCGKFKHVPFTCKSRFCNSCGAKYTQDRAASISSKLFGTIGMLFYILRTEFSSVIVLYFILLSVHR